MCNRAYITGILAASVVLSLVPIALGAAWYSVTDLGTLGGPSSDAAAVNESGQVVGSSADAGGTWRAFIWDSVNGMRPLAMPPGATSAAARKINNAGQIVGSFTRVHAYDTKHAAYWVNPLAAFDLGADGGYLSYCNDINDSGVVVGGFTQNGVDHAFTWSESAGWQTLYPPGSLHTYAHTINNNGTIAGAFIGSNWDYWPTQAAVWQSSSWQILSNSSLRNTSCVDINAAGHIVGAVNWVSGGPASFFFWDGSNMEIVTPGLSEIGISAMNDSDVCVGGYWPDDNSIHAIIWDHTNGAIDLNTLTTGSGWTLRYASSINNAGEIVGEGLNPSGQYHGFLLTPIPRTGEPVGTGPRGSLSPAAPALAWGDASTKSPAFRRMIVEAEHRMKAISVVVLLAAGIVLLLSDLARAGTWEVRTLPEYASEAVISGSRIAYSIYDGVDSDVRLYDIPTNTVTKVTDNNNYEAYIDIDGQKIVYEDTSANYAIRLYDCNSQTMTTINSTNGNWYGPQVSGNNVAWEKYVAPNWDMHEIYLYRGATGTTTRITNNTYEDAAPKIDGNHLVWVGKKNGADDVFLYDLATQITTQITDNAIYDDGVQICGNNVVWDRSDGAIFYYNIATGITKQIASNAQYNMGAVVSNNRIAWRRYYGAGSSDVFLYDIPTDTTLQVTNTGLSVQNLDVSDQLLVWGTQVPGYSGGDIFAYDGASTTKLSLDGSWGNEYPQVDGMYVCWDGYTSSGSHVFVAVPEPVSLAVLGAAGFCAVFRRRRPG